MTAGEPLAVAPSFHMVRANLAQYAADVYVLPTRYLSEGKGVARQVVEALVDRDDEAVERIRQDLQNGFGRAGGSRVAVTTCERTLDGQLVGVVAVDSSSHYALSARETIRQALDRAIALGCEVSKDPSREVIVAVPALGTGHHDQSSPDFADAWVHVVAELERNLLPRRVQVHLVLWTETTYTECLRAWGKQTAVEVQEERAGWGAAAERVRQALDARRAFLFVGSGLSFNSTPPKPEWPKLFPSARVNALGDDLLKNFRHRLPDIAQLLVDQEDDSWPEHEVRLREHFLHQLDSKSLPGLAHYQLLGLPWQSIITTNYDTLIEDTLDSIRIPYEIVRTDRDLVKLARSPRLPVLKIHGGRSKRKVLAADAAGLIATRDDYDGFFKLRPGLAAYLESQMLTSTGLIVGYGLEDEHFRALFARIGKIHHSVHNGDRADSFNVFAAHVGGNQFAPYWKRRGVFPLGVSTGREFGWRVSRFVTSIQHARREKLLPEGQFDGAWQGLLEGVEDDAQRFTLICALVEAGCRPPERELKRYSGKKSERFRRYLSPEAFARVFRETSL